MIKLVLLYFNVIFLSFFSFVWKLNVKSSDRYIIKVLIPYFFGITFYIFFIDDYLLLDNDLIRYINFYSDLNSYEDFVYYSSADLDFVFYGAMFVLKKIGFSSIFFIKFILGLSLFFLFKAIFKLFEDKSDVFLCLLLFYTSSAIYLLFGNVIRQGLAASILLYILAFIDKKNYIVKIVLPFIHKAVIPYYFSKLLPNKKVYIISFFAVSVVFSYYMITILSLVLNLTGLGSLDFYLNSFERASADNSFLKLGILIFNFVYFTVFFERKRMKEITISVYKTFVVFALFTISFYQIDGVFSRLNFFCTFLCLPLHVLYFKEFKNIHLKRLIYFCLIFFCLAYSIYLFSHPSILYNLNIKTP